MGGELQPCRVSILVDLERFKLLVHVEVKNGFRFIYLLIFFFCGHWGPLRINSKPISFYYYSR